MSRATPADLAGMRSDTASPRVLLLGEHASACASHILATCPAAALETLPEDTPLDAIRRVARVDLALLSDIQAWQTPLLAEQSVALLRDHLAARLWVGVSAAGPVTRADCLALGLRGIAAPVPQSEPRNWYSYSIIDYKRAPDWLNADHWANPERWNQERW
ncbi:MAG: DUF6231 family protein [Pseudomonadota bacterium]